MSRVTHTFTLQNLDTNFMYYGDVTDTVAFGEGRAIRFHIFNGAWSGILTDTGFLIVDKTGEVFDLKLGNFNFEWESKEPNPLWEIPF